MMPQVDRGLMIGGVRIGVPGRIVTLLLALPLCLCLTRWKQNRREGQEGDGCSSIDQSIRSRGSRRGPAPVCRYVPGAVWVVED